MTDTLGRIIKRPPAGTAGTTNPFADLSALTGGAVGIWDTSDLNLLLQENSFRTLVTAPGWDDVSVVTPGSAARNPTVSDIDWRNPATTTGACNACYGAHWIAPVGTAPSTFPKIVLKMRVSPAGTSSFYLGLLFALMPGRYTALDETAKYVSVLIPGASLAWSTATLEITNIETQHLAPVSLPIVTGDGGSSTSPVPESLSGLYGTLYFGAYSTGGKSSLGPISIYLAPNT